MSNTAIWDRIAKSRDPLGEAVELLAVAEQRVTEAERGENVALEVLWGKKKELAAVVAERDVLEAALRGLLEYVDLLERGLTVNLDWHARIMDDARAALAGVTDTKEVSEPGENAVAETRTAPTGAARPCVDSADPGSLTSPVGVTDTRDE